MKYYFAPMEGVTGYIFRNAYHNYYKGIDKFYAPFFSPAKEGSMTKREERDLLPENNQGILVVPQVMTNNAEYFIRAMRDVKRLGYHELNLNLGCPSGTVVSKGKGSGFLSKQDELEKFFDTVFASEEAKEMNISVKTRLGRLDPEEFYDILQIYNWYPISELTVHPRIQKDFYKGQIRMDFFDHALLHSENTLVYNGDLCRVQEISDVKNRIDQVQNKNDLKNLVKESGDCIDYKKEIEKLPKVEAFMLGRGLLKNPELIEQYLVMESSNQQNQKEWGQSGGGQRGRGQAESSKMKSGQAAGRQIEAGQIEGSTMSCGSMERIQMECSQMEGSQIERSPMEGSRIERSPMEGSTMSCSSMERIQMECSQMEGSRIERSLMEGSQMERSQMTRSQMEGCHMELDYGRMKAFHDEIYAKYKEIMSPDKVVLYRMKELWAFLAEAFPNCEKQIKRIRKAERFDAYDAAVMQIFRNNMF